LGQAILGEAILFKPGFGRQVIYRHFLVAWVQTA